jgi:hypothetical protein
MEKYVSYLYMLRGVCYLYHEENWQWSCQKIRCWKLCYLLKTINLSIRTVKSQLFSNPDFFQQGKQDFDDWHSFKGIEKVKFYTSLCQES